MKLHCTLAKVLQRQVPIVHMQDEKEIIRGLVHIVPEAEMSHNWISAIKRN